MTVSKNQALAALETLKDFGVEQSKIIASKAQDKAKVSFDALKDKAVKAHIKYQEAKKQNTTKSDMDDLDDLDEILDEMNSDDVVNAPDFEIIKHASNSKYNANQILLYVDHAYDVSVGKLDSVLYSLDVTNKEILSDDYPLAVVKILNTYYLIQDEDTFKYFVHYLDTNQYVTDHLLELRHLGSQSLSTIKLINK